MNRPVVHISYFDGANYALKYATQKSGDWECVTVDTGRSVEAFTAIAADSLGHAHIAYNLDIFAGYATNASGDWLATKFPNLPTVRHAGIHIDRCDKVHLTGALPAGSELAYLTNKLEGSDLRRARILRALNDYLPVFTLGLALLILPKSKYWFIADGWCLAHVSRVFSSGWRSSAAVDSLENVHIAHYDGNKYCLLYTTEQDGIWTSIDVDTDGDVGGFPGIAIDSQDRIHIVYHDRSREHLKYAIGRGGEFRAETVDEGEVGEFASLCVDSMDNVHISYYDRGKEDLKYATGSSGQFRTEKVDPTGGVGKYSSIAVDRQNHVHISYYDEYNIALRYATGTAGNWNTQIIDQDDEVGKATSIAVSDV